MQLKFILHIIQLYILNQLFIDKFMHSFIIWQPLFLSVNRFIVRNQLVSFFLLVVVLCVLPVSGAPDVFSWMSIVSLYASH